MFPTKNVCYIFRHTNLVLVARFIPNKDIKAREMFQVRKSSGSVPLVIFTYFSIPVWIFKGAYKFASFDFFSDNESKIFGGAVFGY